MHAISMSISKRSRCWPSMPTADRADAVVTTITATLGTSVLAEVAQLVGVGLDPATFVGHRHHVGCDSFDAAFDLATSLLGSTALATESTFALRSRMAGGEAWEPAIVLVASDYVCEVEEALPARAVPGLAVVVAGPLDAACHALGRPGVDLAPRTNGDRHGSVRSRWRRADRHHRARRACLGGARVDHDRADDADDTADVEATIPDWSLLDWSLLVRLLGPVDVVDEQGVLGGLRAVEDAGS